jgi:hypothetical protein
MLAVAAFSDGDITGIEIADGYIRLTKMVRRVIHCCGLLFEEKAFDALEIVYA